MFEGAVDIGGCEAVVAVAAVEFDGHQAGLTQSVEKAAGRGPGDFAPATSALAGSAPPPARAKNIRARDGSSTAAGTFGTLIATHLVAGLYRSVVVAAAGFLTAAALDATFVRPTTGSSRGVQ
ncbi:hypothetical protein [Streptomyces sp. NPDC050564]|uniref:hypothetical protein n=1 Tax=Streptomyces sp. NPDC050564 TaxID=3365631 RepID=UPI0037B081CF